MKETCVRKRKNSRAGRRKCLKESSEIIKLLVQEFDSGNNFRQGLILDKSLFKNNLLSNVLKVNINHLKLCIDISTHETMN